eukprot:3022796-Heterocapsa_arctica.AAC.1
MQARPGKDREGEAIAGVGAPFEDKHRMCWYRCFAFVSCPGKTNNGSVFETQKHILVISVSVSGRVPKKNLKKGPPFLKDSPLFPPAFKHRGTPGCADLGWSPKYILPLPRGIYEVCILSGRGMSQRRALSNFACAR